MDTLSLTKEERIFLPRNKHLLISWLQSPYVVILEPPKIKSVTVSVAREDPLEKEMATPSSILA